MLKKPPEIPIAANRRRSRQTAAPTLAVGGVLFLLQLTAGLLLFETAAFENGGIGLLFGDLCGGAAALHKTTLCGQGQVHTIESELSVFSILI